MWPTVDSDDAPRAIGDRAVVDNDGGCDCMLLLLAGRVHGEGWAAKGRPAPLSTLDHDTLLCSKVISAEALQVQSWCYSACGAPGGIAPTTDKMSKLDSFLAT